MSEHLIMRSQTRSPVDGSPRPQSAGPFGRGGRYASNHELRIQEKAELGSLNNRLAAYIDRVRQLEGENHRLTVHIRSVEEALSTKEQHFRDNFDTELRKIHENIGKENERLRGENDLLKQELIKLRERVPELQHFNHESETGRIKAESQVRDLLGKLKGLEDEKNLWEQEAKNIQIENNELHRRIKDLDGVLQEERDRREDAENRLEDLIREFEKFKNEHSRKTEMLREEYVSKVEQVRREMAGQHEELLQESLARVRQEMQEQIENSRQPLRDMYEQKLQTMQEQLDRFRSSANDANAQLQQLHSQLGGLERERNNYAEQIKSLERDNSNLRQELQHLRTKFEALLTQADQEKRQLERELDDLMQKYSDVLDAKVQLHTEIAAYRGMLEGEEARLHMGRRGHSMPQPQQQQMIHRVHHQTKTSTSSVV